MLQLVGIERMRSAISESRKAHIFSLMKQKAMKGLEIKLPGYHKIYEQLYEYPLVSTLKIKENTGISHSTASRYMHDKLAYVFAVFISAANWGSVVAKWMVCRSSHNILGLPPGQLMQAAASMAIHHNCRTRCLRIPIRISSDCTLDEDTKPSTNRIPKRGKVKKTKYQHKHRYPYER